MSSVDPIAVLSPQALQVLAEFLRRREGEDHDLPSGAALARELQKIRAELESHGALTAEGTPPGEKGTSAEILSADLGPHLREILEHIAADSPPSCRYRREAFLDRGGIGEVHLTWDRNLRRRLAMKVLREKHWKRSSARHRQRVLAHFLEEAQITAQLDHPGIVPVHDLAVDETGRPYFTMKLVRGENLQKILEHVQGGRKGWTQTRAVGVLLRVCEAMAFAHSRGVVHRDLKPANIMVGRFGETYVMDFGLARVLGEEITGRTSTDSESSLHTLRQESELPGGPDSPMVSAEGDVVGTPQYMPPEQARGEISKVGPWVDVYAMGAMLYQLLAGQEPYAGIPRHEVLLHVAEHPPAPLSERAPGEPPELKAICEKAMRRAPEERFATLEEMAEELRLYLENRVVPSYRAGIVIAVTKWIERNRATAAALAALVAVMLIATLTIAWKERQNSALALQRERDALAGELRVQRERDFLLAAELLQRADELGPIHPDALPRYDVWQLAVHELDARMPMYEQRRSELLQGARIDRTESARKAELRRQRETAEGLLALRQTQQENARREADHPLAPAADRHEATQETIRQAIAYRLQESRRLRWLESLEQGHVAADPADQAELDSLDRLHRDHQQLIHAEFGAASRILEDRQRAARLVSSSIDAHAEDWTDATEVIGEPEFCPLYEGLALAPQVGLVPLGRNAATGLYEFWHVLSGARPEPLDGGRYRITDATGLVFILVPGGASLMGAQNSRPEGPHYDPDATSLEGPVHEVRLDPYFLSRYEMTQAQWMRASGAKPSCFHMGAQFAGSGVIRGTHPVETVSWEESRRVLLRWSLDLPTEAQWERAARAGGDTPYWSGRDYASLRGRVNLADQSLQRVGFSGAFDDGVDDGFPFHAPVDSLDFNDFGFFGIGGNVWEWCRDSFFESYEGLAVAAGTGEHLPAIHLDRAIRDASFRDPPPESRLTSRYRHPPDWINDSIGLRPVRHLDP